jgi:hypothetical protein
VEKSAKFVSSIDEHREKRRKKEMNIEEQNRDYVSEGLWVTIATDTILR